MSRKLKIFICMFLLAFMLSGCAAPAAESVVPTEAPAAIEAPAEAPEVDTTVQPEEPTPTPEEAPSLLGEVNGNQYINQAVGITAQIPEGWFVADEEQLSAVIGFTQEMIKSIDEMAPESNSVIMICSENDFSSESDLNTNINISFSNQAAMKALFNDKAVFDQTIESMDGMYEQLYPQIYPNATVETSGEQQITMVGKSYAQITIVTTYDGGTMYQDMYFVDLKDGVLTVTGTYYDKADKAIIDAFVSGITYE